MREKCIRLICLSIIQLMKRCEKYIATKLNVLYKGRMESRK